MIGALSIVCGLTLLYIIYRANEKLQALVRLKPGKQTLAMAVLLVLCGGADFLPVASEQLLALRLAIGSLFFGASRRVRYELARGGLLLAGMLIIIRSLLIYFGRTP